MSKFFLAIFVFCLFETLNAACLAPYREPSVYIPSCFDVVTTGVVTCPLSCPSTSTSSFCNCGTPSCNCFKDTANVCGVCQPQSPICSCLDSLNMGCNCGAKKSFIYFPEVEYPHNILEKNPFFFNTCWYP